MLSEMELTELRGGSSKSGDKRSGILGAIGAQ